LLQQLPHPVTPRPHRQPLLLLLRLLATLARQSPQLLQADLLRLQALPCMCHSHLLSCQQVLKHPWALPVLLLLLLLQQTAPCHCHRSSRSPCAAACWKEHRPLLCQQLQQPRQHLLQKPGRGSAWSQGAMVQQQRAACQRWQWVLLLLLRLLCLPAV
jgi:hypothetical protein